MHVRLTEKLKKCLIIFSIDIDTLDTFSMANAFLSSHDLILLLVEMPHKHGLIMGGANETQLIRITRILVRHPTNRFHCARVSTESIQALALTAPQLNCVIVASQQNTITNMSVRELRIESNRIE